MQRLIDTPGPLLDEKGRLAQTGYATSLLRAYDRRRVAASRLRIKEWDYYCVVSDRYALALTIADNGYMGLDSVSLLDFDGPWETTQSKMCVLPLGKRGLPATSEKGDVSASGKGYALHFENDGRRRRLYGHMDSFRQGLPLLFDVTLSQPPRDSMVIMTPFARKPTAFYYNQKINCLRAEGKVLLGDTEYLFSPMQNSPSSYTLFMCIASDVFLRDRKYRCPDLLNAVFDFTPPQLLSLCVSITAVNTDLSEYVITLFS